MNTIVEHMRDQRTYVNITTNKPSNSIPDEVRNEIDFHIGGTTSITTSCSLSSSNYSQQNNNEDNSNKENQETSDNEEHDSHSNQDSTVNCRRYLKRRAYDNRIKFVRQKFEQDIDLHKHIFMQLAVLI